MRKDVREFIRRLDAVGLTVESTQGHYNVLRDDKPLRQAKRNAVHAPVLARHDLAGSQSRFASSEGSRGRGRRDLHASAVRSRQQ